MKTKTLIKVLQKLDPSGELEVCIGNKDIVEIKVLPANYDGRLEILQRHEVEEGYNISGIEMRSKGQKVSIEPYGLEYYVFDHYSDLDNLNITFDSEPDPGTLELIEKYKENANEINDVVKRLKKDKSNKINF